VNFQNIPRDDKTIKRAFLPKRGAFSFFDYSQIEPRYFAYFTATALKDPTVADWYREGRDVYREIAGRALDKPADEVTEDERQHGKVWFLMSLYGAGPRKVSETLGIPYAEAKDFYLAFHEGLPWIKQLSNPKPQSAKAMRFWEPGAIERTYQRRGFLRTPHGRHLHAEQYGEHKLLNKLIQGSAADLMKAALIRVDRWQRAAGIESRMVSVIHDEIIFDGPEEEIPLLHEEVPPLMREDFLTAVVPIEIDHEVSVTSWAEKVSYEDWQASRVKGIAA
jgi:DNA polymerase-1